MNSQTLRRGIVVLSLLAAFVCPATGEELVLKDGRRIVGTIVGYENDMFRVETDFGIALVRKDKVASVNFAPPGSKEQSGKPSDGKGGPSPSAAGKNSQPRAADVSANLAEDPAASKSSPAAAAPPPVSRPLNEPLPSRLQERVEGTEYVSETFGFSMFKPPGWKVYEEVPKETGSAIMAMGTEDEQTLLFVDRQVWSGAPDLNDDRSEANLRGTYEDYQKISESVAQIDGQPAVRRVFKGLLEGVEWHGLSVHMARGNTVFGIVGLTSAETFEFKQAVFNKIIKSFRFVSGGTGTHAAAQGKASP